MSTGLNCEFVRVVAEAKPDRWYYVLEDGSAPKQCWDWHDYATAYGSFKDEDEASRHLRDHHANPGGSFDYDVAEEDLKLEKRATLAKLLAKATKNLRRW